MASDELVGAVEACLFAAGAPVTLRTLAEAVGAEVAEVREAVTALRRQREGTGVEIEQVAGGVQLRTALRHAGAVQRLLGARPQKLSQAALEVLAVVAYRQPVTRGEIEAMRGVDSGGVLKTLIDRSLLRTAGRADEPGRPLLYRTTASFLELFRLPDIKALPTMAERASLTRGYSGPQPGDDDGLDPEGEDAEAPPAEPGSEQAAPLATD